MLMRDLNKMSIMTTLSLCVSCAGGIRILGRGPTFFCEQGLAWTKSGPDPSHLYSPHFFQVFLPVPVVLRSRRFFTHILALLPAEIRYLLFY